MEMSGNFPGFSEFPAIAAITNQEWNEICAYAEVHDIERGSTDEDYFAECHGMIGVYTIVPNAIGPLRMGHCRVQYAPDDQKYTDQSKNPLSIELRTKIQQLAGQDVTIVRVLDGETSFVSDEEEQAVMTIAEATRYFSDLYHKIFSKPY